MSKKKTYQGRDVLVQKIIGGATKAGIHKDLKKEANRMGSRQWEEEYYIDLDEDANTILGRVWGSDPWNHFTRREFDIANILAYKILELEALLKEKDNSIKALRSSIRTHYTLREE